ncbi:MAG: hypothetical protein JST13_13575, partial [Bacteroidetes bacterium]|nr:hypothetical protein [Bacteroidota bacterium]
MKKIILLAAVAAFHYANAQSAPSAYAVNAKTVRQNAYDYFEKFGSSDVSVNSKALKTFSKSYAAATDAQWSVFDDNSSTCRFYVKGILHRAYYTSNGLWKGTLITYHEELLPENIREMVANDLPEYNITLVNEV